MDDASEALLTLGRALQAANYEFVTITPESRRRVVARRGGELAIGRTPRDIFGWNLWFEPDALPTSWLELLVAADACRKEGKLCRSKLRFSTFSERLFVHSCAPTEDADSVFFGPDTYRFCALLQRFAPRAKRLVDVGCGTGAGGLTLAHTTEQLVLADINEQALRLTRVNAALSRTEAEVVQSDVLDSVAGPIDAVVSNPPYLRDDAQRLYRDGGGSYGEALGVRILRAALARLEPRGTVLIYTGSAIVEGRDCFLEQAKPLLEERGARYSYFELDPDVFGEELDLLPYASVDRLAAVALCARVP